MSKKYFIGIDAGTSVMKSVLFDENGREVDVAQAKVPVLNPKPGHQEQHMADVWDAAKDTLRRIVGSAGADIDKLEGIGVTGQGAGTWLVDESGSPVRDAILWTDGRAADIIRQWESDGTAREVFKICGNIQYPGCQSSILKWLADNEPDSLKKAAKTLWCKDWVVYNLTGRMVTDASDASVSFLDVRTREYDPKLLELMGIADHAGLLPNMVPCSEVTDEVRPALAQELGLPAHVKVVLSPFDMVASSLGVGAVNHGDACSILGTALISEVTQSELSIEPLEVGFTLCHGIPGQWVRAMGAMLGTPNLDWFLESFAHEDKVAAEKAGQNIFAYVEEAIKKIPIGSNGIVYHHYLSPAGERSPFVNSNARAQFVGMSQEHTRHHLLRAVFEGVALAMKHSYDSIPGTIERVSLSGGGANSPEWCQIIADALNAEVRIPAGTEFGAKGATINTMTALGLVGSYEEATDRLLDYDRVYEPRADAHERYAALSEVYTRVYELMGEPWEMLGRFRNRFQEG